MMHLILEFVFLAKTTRMQCSGHAVCIRKMRNAYKVLVHKPEWKRPVYPWKHNIKLDLKKNRIEGCRLS
jgi:hypothetical protein